MLNKLKNPLTIDKFLNPFCFAFSRKALLVVIPTVPEIFNKIFFDDKATNTVRCDTFEPFTSTERLSTISSPYKVWQNKCVDLIWLFDKIWKNITFEHIVSSFKCGMASFKTDWVLSMTSLKFFRFECCTTSFMR